MNGAIDRSQLLAEIRDFASSRDYTETPISKAQMLRILEAGRRAPSAKNRQAWRFIAVSDADVRQKISDACYGEGFVSRAQLIIVACTTNINYRMSNGQLSYPIDIAIAVSFMMLQALHERLGACMVGTFNETILLELLSVPYSMRIPLLLTVGETIPDSLQSQPRSSLDRIASFNHW